ncbi:hypothetical protein [Arthrobacter sp. NyZ413]|uniref:hypothetical protein n=1 Tax=Arthrobacter sp. NyZ413 TaxID=3144669 RepID=UPI002BF7AC52|nr:hypothetical protein [Arthrobacter sp.]
MSTQPDVNPQEAAAFEHQPTDGRPARLEYELRAVYVPQSGLFRDDEGREFFVTAVEFWEHATVVSLCWKRRPMVGQGSPPLLVTDEKDHVLGVKRIWNVGARSIQHYEPMPPSARSLTVLIERRNGPQELFSCRTPPAKKEPMM